MDADFLCGWHPSDGQTLWSMEEALVAVRPRRAAGSLRIVGILPPSMHDPGNRIDVEVDGEPLGIVDNNTREMQSFDATFPLARIAAVPLTIKFHTIGLYRPSDNGSADFRCLGFALQRLELLAPEEDVPPDARLSQRARRLRRLALMLRVGNAVRGLAGRLPRRRRPRTTEWKLGLTVIIPERASPALLEDCLRHAHAAARATNEPFEFIVVVNGSPLAEYRELRERYPAVRWLHSEDPLSFATAVRRGLKHARYDGVYVLNNDMVLGEETLSALLPWRRPNVFAIASQIVFADPAERREKTGWNDVRLDGAQVAMYGAEPEADGGVRGHLYPAGGSSLFRRQYLERLQNRRDPYAPFSFEDAEWGITAWREGYEVLFCPASRVLHHDRATISRFFEPADVDRIIARNGLQFLLRNLLHATEPNRFLKMARDPARCPDLTLRELTSLRSALALAAAQWRGGRAPCRDAPLEHLRRKYYPAPPSDAAALPCLLLVSPYAIFPPAHGGAIRIAELLQTLRERFRVVLLSDEEPLYTPDSVPYFAGLHAVHLVGGRPAEDPAKIGQRIPRMLNHAHPRLRAELRRLLACYEPAVVQVEFVELAASVEERRDGAAWFITLHDVLFSADGASADDRFEHAFVERFDAAIVCSAEDAALVRAMPVEVVPNGTRLAEMRYVPSAGNTSVLFAGPFRYVQNLEGIRRFLETVYPALKQTVPELRLLVLGGRDAPRIARDIPCFAQPGVEVCDFAPNIAPYLELCALTINPLVGIRGSSIKLIESLAAGRVCVSTVDGARGFLDGRAAALVTAERIEEFGPLLERLLLDEPYRLALERPAPGLRAASSWSSSAQRLLDVYGRYAARRA
jgi:GT2 family glycosyltransferase